MFNILSVGLVGVAKLYPPYARFLPKLNTSTIFRTTYITFTGLYSRTRFYTILCVFISLIIGA